MATFLADYEAPLYGEIWTSPDGEEFFAIQRSFPRWNRMVWLVESIDTGYSEYFVFPY